MKRFRLVLCFLLGALVVAGAAQADGSSDDEGKCRAVRARGVGQDPGNGTTTATITNGGILNSTGRFTETVRGTLCLADDDDDDDD